MALVNIETALADLLHHLKRCSVGGGMELLSYKRNRTIAVIKEKADEYRILEKGYVVDEETASNDQLKKKLKKMIKREFPRSRKIRLYTFDSVDELGRIHQKI
ncbi:hypothetical protein [Desulforhopalus sp. 52FAK]